MNRFGLLKQINTDLAARVIIDLGKKFHDNPEGLTKHLEGKITEEDLRRLSTTKLEYPKKCLLKTQK